MINLFNDLNKDSYKNSKYVSLPIFKQTKYSDIKTYIKDKYKHCYALKKSKNSHIMTIDEFMDQLEENKYLDYFYDSANLTIIFDDIDKTHMKYFNILKYLENGQNTSMFFTSETLLYYCIKTYKTPLCN